MRPRAASLAAGLAAALAAAPLAAAQDARIAWVPNPRVRDGTWVSDPSRHLRPATVAALNQRISALEAATTAEIAVVVVDSTKGLEPFDFALALHRGWGVGKRGRDNGIVLLWVPAQRAIQISVGYGLEGVLPDRRVGRIRDTDIFPAFRDGRFDEGVLAAMAALAAAIRGESATGTTPGAATGAPPAASDRGDGDGGGGGFLLFGLGGMGALGIGGGYYRRWRRRRPRQCSNGHQMRLLSETADDALLDDPSRLEEQLHSVDWDVWACDGCGEVQRIPYNRLFASYGKCPKCERRTLKSTTQTIVRATTSHGGLERVTSTCKNCGFTQTTERSTPRISRSSSYGGSSGGGGGGSSFGGGSAGGGGAGGRY